jgi:hypothetical protein
MPNILPTDWVKNVYNMCAYIGKKCAWLYTGTPTSLLTTQKARVKPLLFTHLTTSFTPAQYTGNISLLTPTNHYFSPLSTAPIISKAN